MKEDTEQKEPNYYQKNSKGEFVSADEDIKFVLRHDTRIMKEKDKIKELEKRIEMLETTIKLISVQQIPTYTPPPEPPVYPYGQPTWICHY